MCPQTRELDADTECDSCADPVPVTASSGSPAYLNGRFLPVQEASVPVMDRGFLFGDGVYELIPVYGGRVFRIDQHLRRLERSLSETGIPNPYPRERWREVAAELVRRAGPADLSVYLQVTRGVASLRDHAFPEAVTPTVFAMATPLSRPRQAWLEAGISAVVLEDIRWRRCDIKGISLLANVLLRERAVELDAVEAILVRDGHVTEGAASNVIVVRDGVLQSPANGPELLAGVTRDLVLELARVDGLPVEERVLPREALATADEIWVTSSSKEILAVTRLDGQGVGTGRPGPLWQRVHALFQTYKSRLARGHADPVQG